MKDLQVTVQSAGGALTISPLSLLNYFLPDAKPLPGNPQVYEGHVPGDPTKKCYMQVEALAGALMDMREKHISLSEIYLIPSSSPDKRASHKIKYTVSVERVRKIPGFLGMNMGLLVERGGQICETNGPMAIQDDVIQGAWAEAYIQGFIKPFRYEVSAKEFWGKSKTWEQKGAWMMVKVAVDHLCRMCLASMYSGEQEHSDGSGGEIMLEATSPAATPPPPRKGASPAQPAGRSYGPRPDPFAAGTLYVGTIAELSPREGKRAGHLTIETESGPLTVFFWSRPQALKEQDQDTSTSLIGRTCGLSFTEKEDKSGKVWRYLETLDLAPEADEPGATPPAAQQEAEGDLL